LTKCRRGVININGEQNGKQNPKKTDRETEGSLGNS
jgi:hypothetical protein